MIFFVFGQKEQNNGQFLVYPVFTKSKLSDFPPKKKVVYLFLAVRINKMREEFMNA
jgi:hypothetical protein